MDSEPQRIATAATGGAGQTFEERTAAYFLCLLLGRAVPPLFPDCMVSEVQLQTRNSGWWTDDVLIKVDDNGGLQRQIAVQCKLGLRISKDDEESRAVIIGAWNDFRNRRLFNPERDCLAFVVQRGTDSIVRNFSSLLERCRTCKSLEEFASSVYEGADVTKKARQQLASIEEIIREDKERDVEPRELWGFLRCLRVLVFDFDSCGQTTSAIRTVLGATANAEHHAVQQATSTWNTLFELAADGMSRGATFRRNDLPEAARKSHERTLDRGRDAIIRLQNHGRPVIQRIRHVVGESTQIDRQDLVSELLEKLRQSSVVVISGTAGSGKSVVARKAVELLEGEAYVFAFRGEEFAKPHIDETLSSAQIGVQGKELFDLLSSHDRKVILIESVERLLEKGQREALGDLLRLVRDDRSWQVLITCREYSSDLFCKAFLEDEKLPVTVCKVPPLTDGELQKVAGDIPSLKRPVADVRLGKLLRNPYLLGMAAKMTWSETDALPSDERSFRQAVWREVVKREGNSGHMLACQRGEAFQAISLRRARALSPFANCGDLDRAILSALRADELIEFCEENDRLVAPAHDVLEDWAILQWLDSQFATYEGDHEAFLAEIGTHPAMRRAYRQWLGTLIGLGGAQRLAFAFTVAVDDNVSKQIRDDTLVSVLLSEHGPEFLERSESRLVAENYLLLLRVLHLLRVGCVTPPTWLSGVKGVYVGMFLVPQGPSWKAALSLVEKHADRLVEEQALSILGFISDWARLVCPDAPYPEGVEHVAVICSHLLGIFERKGYREEESLKGVIELIVKLPKACENDFLQLLDRAKEKKHNGPAAEIFRKLILEDISSAHACRDYPDKVLELAETRWRPTKTQESRNSLSAFGLVEVFGLSHRADHMYVPPSAWQGPFLHLLRHHPSKGVRWIVDFLNEAVASYAADTTNTIEAPWEVELNIGGVLHKQWANDRLWRMYRGSSVAPAVLQCSLMALEGWMLECCEQAHNIEPALRWILKSTNNVATTAVVASIGMAHPEICGAWTLPLFSCREIFRLDLARMVADQTPTNAVVNRFIPVAPWRKIYSDEREKSDNLPHRKEHLEYLAVRLQMGALREPFQEILDKHIAAVSGMSEPSEEVRLWQVALHRMDVRNFEVKGELEDGRILIQSGAPEPELQAMIDKNLERQVPFQQGSSLLMWGMKAFQDGLPEGEKWEARLSEAMVLQERVTETHETEEKMIRGGISHVAAVCLRDRWDDLNAAQRQWGVKTAIDAVRKRAESNHWSDTIGKNAMDEARPSAYVLPLIYQKETDQRVRQQVEAALKVALSHASDEVREYAAAGIGRFLWEQGAELPLRCVGLCLQRAALAQEYYVENLTEPEDRRAAYHELQYRANRDAANSFASITPQSWTVNCSESYDFDSLEAEIPLLLNIFATNQAAQEGHAFMCKLSSWLAGIWCRRETDRSGEREDTNYDLESHCLNRIGEYSMRLSSAEAVEVCLPFINATEQIPDRVADLVDDMACQADKGLGTECFWAVWAGITEKLFTCRWVKHLRDEHSWGEKLTRALFLGLPWKEGVRDWKPLEQNWQRVDDLFCKLPICAVSLDAYCRYLYYVGERSLPGALALIRDKLETDTDLRLLGLSNIGFCLDSILRRFVYGKPTLVKSDKRLRESILFLLDAMVENGSSSAYLIRDDFVTPLAG